METHKKIKVAKYTGAAYFGLLGTVNLVASYGGGFKTFDIISFILLWLPLMVNKKLFYLIYGGIATLVALYMGIACLMFSQDPYTNTTQFSFLMGFLLSASMLFSALLLMYAGLQSTNKSRFTLI